jgi:membrane fusion protein, multidrug efflux system
MRKLAWIVLASVLPFAAGAWWGPGLLERVVGQGEGVRAPGVSQTGRRGRGGADKQDPVPILAAAAARADVPVIIAAVGTARPAASVALRSQVDGQIVALQFREGQDVRKGDVLARIDPTLYQAQLDQALARKAQNEALLENARRDLDRYTRLAESNAATKQQADTQRSAVAQFAAQVKADQAAIDSARATLAYTQVKAPFDGRTGIRNVDEGTLVRASDAAGIVTISQITPIAVVFNVPQQQLPRIVAAMAAGPVQVEAMDNDDKAALDRGVLDVIDNQVDASTGTVRLKASFPNTALALWPGAFVNVRLLVETLRDVVVVPTAAVQRGPKGTFVFALGDGVVTIRPVAVVQQDERQAVIGSGLTAGEQVAISSFARLAQDTKVIVSEPGASPPAPGAAGPASAGVEQPATRPLVEAQPVAPRTATP